MIHADYSNSKDITAQALAAQDFATRPLMSDYEVGYKAYWRGKSDSTCGNQEQLRGWYAACTEDSKGRDAYLQAMAMAAADGESVNWRNVYDQVGIVCNAYGDVVVGI